MRRPGVCRVAFQTDMAPSRAARSFPSIEAVRTFLVEGVGSGGDYHNV